MVGPHHLQKRDNNRYLYLSGCGNIREGNEGIAVSLDSTRHKAFQSDTGLPVHKCIQCSSKPGISLSSSYVAKRHFGLIVFGLSFQLFFKACLCSVLFINWEIAPSSGGRSPLTWHWLSAPAWSYILFMHTWQRLMCVRRLPALSVVGTGFVNISLSSIVASQKL